MSASFFTAVFLPTGLAIVMLGMGLTLLPADFQRVTRYPKAVAVGLVSQLVLLPLVGFSIVSVVPMPPELAVGLTILAICPGGVSSNLITYLAKGDVALSVTLTAFSSAITVFSIPLIANLALRYFIGQNAAIALPIAPTMLQIFFVTLVPVGLGMWLRQQFPNLASRLEKVTNRLAIAILVLIILTIVVSEWHRLPTFFAQVGIGVVLLNVISASIGFWLAKLFHLNFAQQICIAIEVGIQNCALGIAITAGLLNNPTMAVPAAVYGLFMNFTAIAIVFYGRRFARQIDREEKLQQKTGDLEFDRSNRNKQ
jgi:BASS family bile acid:Na+ symporter